VNTTATRPTLKQVEDAATQVQRHTLQAVDLAGAGNWRKAHAAAEAAQGAARRLKELLGAAAQPQATPEPLSRRPSLDRSNNSPNRTHPT
jgi:hypothetical protein